MQDNTAFIALCFIVSWTLSHNIKLVDLYNNLGLEEVRWLGCVHQVITGCPGLKT